MSLMQTAICKQLLSEFDSKMADLARAQIDISNKLNEVTQNLSSLIPSDPFGLISSVESASTTAKGLVPDLSSTIGKLNAINEIQNIISSCTFIQTDPILADAETMLGVLTKQYTSAIDDLAFAALSVYPELDIANKLTEINDMFETLSFKDEFTKMEGMLNCVSAICGTSISSRLSQLNSFKVSIRINATGKFDQREHFKLSGVPTLSAMNANKISTALIESKESVQKQFEAGTGLTSSGVPSPPPVLNSILEGWSVSLTNVDNINVLDVIMAIRSNIGISFNSDLSDPLIINVQHLNKSLIINTNIISDLTVNEILMTSTSISNTFTWGNCTVSAIIINEIILSCTIPSISNVTGTLTVI